VLYLYRRFFELSVRVVQIPEFEYERLDVVVVGLAEGELDTILAIRRFDGKTPLEIRRFRRLFTGKSIVPKQPIGLCLFTRKFLHLDMGVRHHWRPRGIINGQPSTQND